jgi:hypothetical protein
MDGGFGLSLDVFGSRIIILEDNFKIFIEGL